MTDTNETPEVEATPAQARKKSTSAKVEETPKLEPAPKSAYAVVGRDVQDEVHLTVGYGSGKSLTAHHIQRRLAERGFGEVYRDRDGFWRDGTDDALFQFRTSRNLPEDASMREILTSLFENDDNVKIVD